MNMTKGYSILLLMAALTALTGCMADDESLQTGQAPVELMTSVGTEAPTRASATLQETQLDANTTFQVAFGSGTTLTAGTTTTYRTSDAQGHTTCTGTVQPYFALGTAQVTAHGYYPEKPSGTFSVETAQNVDDNYKHSDLMYGTATINKGSAGTLTFARKMVKIVVNTTLGDGVGEIKSVKLVGGYRTINVTDADACTLGDQLSDANSPNSTNITMYSGSHTTGTLTCAALIPPQTVGSAGSPVSFLEVETDEGTATFSLDGKTFESGKVYTYNANITFASIGITTAITGWIESSRTALENNGKEALTPAQLVRDVPLTLEATEDGTTVTFTFNGTMSYSTDGVTWNNYASGSSVTLDENETVSFKGYMGAPAINSRDVIFNNIQCDKLCYVSGNIMSLIDAAGFVGNTVLEDVDNYTFGMLFSENTNIDIRSENPLSLPATKLANFCYASMFYGCTSLTTAPELPATTLATYCYGGMFADCSRLMTAPALLATTLADHCYEEMFYGCTSLTEAPALLAETLADHCYGSMFSRCTKLTSAPALPAETLAEGCYNGMFEDCTSLTTAPELRATTLTPYCYYRMFSRCTSLTTAPELRATTLTEWCYTYMFQGCTSLNSVTCLATNISADGCTYYWLDGVAASGTFTKAASMESWPTSSWLNDYSGIPDGWTPQDAQ